MLPLCCEDYFLFIIARCFDDSSVCPVGKFKSHIAAYPGSFRFVINSDFGPHYRGISLDVEIDRDNKSTVPILESNAEFPRTCGLGE